MRPPAQVGNRSEIRFEMTEATHVPAQFVWVCALCLDFVEGEANYAPANLSPTDAEFWRSFWSGIPIPQYDGKTHRTPMGCI